MTPGKQRKWTIFLLIFFAAVFLQFLHEKAHLSVFDYLSFRFFTAKTCTDAFRTMRSDDKTIHGKTMKKLGDASFRDRGL